MIVTRLHALFRVSLLIVSLGFATAQAEEMIAGEEVSGKGAWIAPPLLESQRGDQRVTVWFDQQFLGDGEAYERRAKEFSQIGRKALRSRVIPSLKNLSDRSFKKAESELEKHLESGEIRDLKRHWIINGFTCTASQEGIQRLAKVEGVKKVFFSSGRTTGTPRSDEKVKAVEPDRPEELSLEKLPWYVAKLQVDRVWKEFGVTGEGTLNVVHDGNFSITPSLSRTVYVNPNEIPNNGKDDDGNGLIDDVHGYNFNNRSAKIDVRKLKGDRSDRRNLHGTSCAHIISGAATGKAPQFGIAPMSRWAGVISSTDVESAIEWAIEQGADTYSMSFSRPGLGETRSHWRKMMEHGSFCGLFFVSGAGNFATSTEVPVQMRTPEDIPNAVFAAAGVQRDLSRTTFSSKGPVEWKTEHYQEGRVQKPLVCAFNAKVPLLMPSGEVFEDALNGNSFAGPMFCGAISLMLSADPDLLPWDLRKIIISTATDVAASGVDYETGHGLINCYAAVQEVLRQKELRKAGLEGGSKEPEMAKSKIETLAGQQLEAYNKHDLEAFVNCYHEEVIVLNSDGKVTVQGRDAFRKRYEGMFSRGSFGATVETRVTHGSHCVDLENWHRVRKGKEVQGTVLVRYSLRDDLIGTVQFLK